MDHISDDRVQQVWRLARLVVLDPDLYALCCALRGPDFVFEDAINGKMGSKELKCVTAARFRGAMARAGATDPLLDDEVDYPWRIYVPLNQPRYDAVFEQARAEYVEWHCRDEVGALHFLSHAVQAVILLQQYGLMSTEEGSFLRGQYDSFRDAAFERETGFHGPR